MASVLLFGLLAFWGQLATGAAACFSKLAPPPQQEDSSTEAPTLRPSHKSITVKRIKSSPE